MSHISDPGKKSGKAAPKQMEEDPISDVKLLAAEVETLRRELAVHTENEQMLRRRDQKLVQLLDVAIRINAEQSLGPLLQEIVESARQVIGCRYAALGILNGDNSGISHFVTAGIDAQTVAEIGEPPQGRGVLGILIDRPKPIRLSDLSKHSDSYGFPANHPPMKTFLGVPIVGRLGPVGNLYCTEKDGGGEFTEEDESVAQMLAAEAAVAVENARFLNDIKSMAESRDRFYAMISHEVRNSLTAVHGWAELMYRKAGPNPPRAVIETVEAAESALEMLNDLLDLSRLDAERMVVHMVSTDGRQIVQAAVGTVEPSARQEGIDIVVDTPNEPIPMETDAKKVQQVLVNLLQNAIRHSRTDKPVRISVKPDGAKIRFSVADEGEGIEPEQIAIIFDAYKRAESRAGGGTGLGLTLSRKLAVLLGGDISVQSSLGKGSVFTVTVAQTMVDGDTNS